MSQGKVKTMFLVTVPVIKTRTISFMADQRILALSGMKKVLDFSAVK